MVDRMFNVLVLGGLALVGCGGSVATEGGAHDATDAGTPGTHDAGVITAEDAEPPSGNTGSSSGGPSRGAGGALDAAGAGPLATHDAEPLGFPSELPPPPPPTFGDAAAQVDSSPGGYADATAALPPCGGVPCETM